MIDEPQRGSLPQRSGAELYLGIAAVLLLFVTSGIISFVNTRTLKVDAEQITHTHEVLAALEEILSFAKDAETGQRGYLITGDERYLEPHTKAVAQIDERVRDVERMTRDNPAQQGRISALQGRIASKFQELEETIALRRTKGFEAALAVVVSDRGKGAMDAIRAKVEEMQEEERRLRNRRLEEMENAYGVTVGTGLLTGLIGVFLVCAVGYLLNRSMVARRRQEWFQTGQIGLSKVMLGEQRVEQLGDNLLRFIAEYLDAQAGALFIKDGHYRRIATYGVASGGGTPDVFEPGDGLLGQAVKDGRTFHVHDVPEGYLAVGSAFGRGKPRHLAVVPIKEDGQVNGVLELGFMRPMTGDNLEFFEGIAESVGVAIRSATFRAHVQNLLHETQRQAEELQAQGEELRVSNEELEEQGRALRDSQGRLELQQAELEQTNSQLEKQAEVLEAQRDDASRAKAAVELQARELEQASRYKSDFLANMSHELRTPLNSSLILAKLLADNREGNLTDEQVQYADTIRSAGNDLLALINDILDLSKIEAGHMEVRSEPVGLPRLVEELGRIFRPVAEQKQLALRVQIAKGCPEVIDTDRQRLEQVIKNLLSNALKFTEAGEVTLDVEAASGDRVAFVVRDTGIGISAQQQRVVFEAFRQADGTTNRKYGGTGLGLSI
ncbi:CHASE3 domain-containing protein, partial [Singulisphaera rosea]